jgi:hypothetical protein
MSGLGGTRFSLGMLTVTTTGVKNMPNMPQISNLTDLARLLEKVYKEIGPFTVISAFRSKEVQQKLKKSGNNRVSENSLHMQGMAADIVPTTMSVKDFYTRVLRKPSLFNQIGEFAYIGSAIHLTLPTATKKSLAMIATPGGSYIPLSPRELEDFKKGNATKIIVKKNAPFYSFLALPFIGLGLWKHAKTKNRYM